MSDQAASVDSTTRVRMFASPLTNAAAAATGPLLRRCGADGLAFDFNDAWLRFTNRALESLRGSGWLEDMHPDDRARHAAIHAAMSAEQRAYTHDYRLMNGGTCGYRWVMEQAVPVRRADGGLAGYDHHCMDVHERTRFSEHLATRANAMRLAMRQHGLFEAALAIELQPATMARDRGRLATMGRLAGGSPALDIARLRLDQWVDAAVASARLAVAPDAPPLVVSVPDQPIELEADRGLLTTALADALVEATRAWPHRPAIELHAVRADPFVKIDVPGREDSSAFALLACTVQAHGGEVLTLADGARIRLCLPLAGAH